VALPFKIDLAKLNLRERVLLVLTALALVGLFYRAVYAPKARQANDLTQRMTTISRELEVLQAQLPVARERADRLRRGEADPADELAVKMQSILSGGGRLSTVLEEVTRLARLKRIEFVAVRPEELKDQGTHYELTMQIDLKARYRELGGYLQALENLPRAMNVRKLRIDTNDDLLPFVMGHLDVITVLPKS
jgi:Tfp pilus assembly protein PilO